MKKGIEIIDALGNTIYPSISIPVIHEDDECIIEREHVGLLIKSENGMESLICLDIETAILLTDSIKHLAGQILLDEARVNL